MDAKVAPARPPTVQITASDGRVQMVVETLDQLERSIGTLYEDGDARLNETSRLWPLIPFDLIRFCRYLDKAHALLNQLAGNLRRRRSFLDVGCGVGTKVFVAKY